MKLLGLPRTDEARGQPAPKHFMVDYNQTMSPCTTATTTATFRVPTTSTTATTDLTPDCAAIEVSFTFANVSECQLLLCERYPEEVTCSASLFWVWFCLWHQYGPKDSLSTFLILQPHPHKDKHKSFWI